MPRIFSLIAISCLAFSSGCSEHERGGPRVKSSPASGVVKVDGVEAVYLQVECHPGEGSSIKYPLSTLTDEKGAFSLGTYEAGDGLPAGSYTLTFTWLEPGLAPFDKLKGAYANPKKSEHTITIVEDVESAPSVIELKTKKGR